MFNGGSRSGWAAAGVGATDGAAAAAADTVVWCTASPGGGNDGWEPSREEQRAWVDAAAALLQMPSREWGHGSDASGNDNGGGDWAGGVLSADFSGDDGEGERGSVVTGVGLPP